MVVDPKVGLWHAAASYSESLGLLWVETGPRRPFVMVDGVPYYGEVGGLGSENRYVVGEGHDRCRACSTSYPYSEQFLFY